MAIDREQLIGEINLDGDGQFRRHWRRRIIEWDSAVPMKDRNAGLFRRRAFDSACDAIDAGITDPEQITEQVCGSFAGSIIVGIVTRLIIQIIVNRILKRLGLLAENCEVSDA